VEYRFLGTTGLEVSELCLGTWRFGEEVDDATSHRILDEFVEAGGTFIDTADVYGYSESERIIGSWLKTRNRDDLVIATKVYGEEAPGALVRGAGRKHVLSAVEASLRRLRTDFVDLYQVHLFDDVTPFEETLSTLDVLVRSGKVRFLGASNYTGWQLQKSLELSRHHGWESFVSLQPNYSLLTRSAELELVPVCANEGLGLIAWSPLEGGWLSGKYRRGMSGPPAGTRAAGNGSWAARDNPHTWRVLDAVRAVAEETCKTPAQVALRWLLEQPAVTAPIFGARTLDQLHDNLGATGWALTEAQLAALTAASEVAVPYPYDLQRLPQFRRRLRHPA
jgi:aryl-alcohol dehydrogenase-like predicted oxidoreductase